MKHLKSFETETVFDSEKTNIDLPWVTLTGDDNKVHFSYEIINEDDLTKGDFIDLGLPSGLKWASCNLGATKPCEYGDYYMWASVTPNTADTCDWEHTPYHEGSDYDTGFTKYNSIESYGKVDNKTVLDTEDDAVHVAIGGKAHIPTKEQFQELLDNTTSAWVNCTYLDSGHENHNVTGIKFTGSNGNSIFFPTAGYRNGTTLCMHRDCGYVWSSSLNSDNTYTAWYLCFRGNRYVDYYSRYYGLPLRPVSKS